MRRTSALAALVILYFSPPAAAAQSAAGWKAVLGVEGIHFAESLTDTLAPAESAASLKPDGRVGLRLALARAFGRWHGELEAGWAAGRIEVGNSLLSLKDKTTRVTRWRLAAALGRRIARIGTGEVELAAGPTLDWWRVTGSNRVRAGGAAWLVLRVPVGGLELENRIGGGISASPLEPADAGPEFRGRDQVAVSASAGLRLPL